MQGHAWLNPNQRNNFFKGAKTQSIENNLNRIFNKTEPLLVQTSNFCSHKTYSTIMIVFSLHQFVMCTTKYKCNMQDYFVKFFQLRQMYSSNKELHVTPVCNNSLNQKIMQPHICPVLNLSRN